MELSPSDVKNIIRLISNHIAFLIDKKIVRHATASYEDSLIKNNNLFEYIRLFFLQEYENKINFAASIKEHKEYIDEMTFITDEIRTIISLYLEQKIKEEKDRERATSLSLRNRNANI
ncbi:MAG: hypothetical protein QXP88_00705 [Thermoproteota archaeon]